MRGCGQPTQHCLVDIVSVGWRVGPQKVVNGLTREQGRDKIIYQTQFESLLAAVFSSVLSAADISNPLQLLQQTRQMSVLVKESRLALERCERRDMMNLVTDHGRGNVWQRGEGGNHCT